MSEYDEHLQTRLAEADADLTKHLSRIRELEFENAACLNANGILIERDALHLKTIDDLGHQIANLKHLASVVRAAQDKKTEKCEECGMAGGLHYARCSKGP